MRRLQHTRRFTTSSILWNEQGASPGAQLDIFDGVLKAAHRDRASRYPAEPDPLADEVASRLVDRMEDCTRSFERALVLGGAGLQVLRQLTQCKSGVQSAMLVDTSPGMLERASQEWKQGRYHTGLENRSGRLKDVEFVRADPSHELLPVDPESFDVVISCLSLHWVNDVPGIMAQCRFALRPDGRFLGAMLGGNTLQELRIACTVAQQEREGGVAPRTSPLAQVRDAGNLLTRAGLAIPTVDVDDITVNYPDVVALVRHLRQLGEGNALRQRREALPRDTALASAAAYTALFGLKQGTDEISLNNDTSTETSICSSGIPATFQVIYLTGWAPDPSQPRAAKRGSAALSFQDLQKAMDKGE